MLKITRHPMSYISLAMAASTLLASPPLRAENGRNDDRVVVQTYDLDLTTKDGRHRLDRRLDRAAYRICSKEGVRPMEYLECQRDTLDSIRPRRNSVVASQEGRKLAMAANAPDQ